MGMEMEMMEMDMEGGLMTPTGSPGTAEVPAGFLLLPLNRVDPHLGTPLLAPDGNGQFRNAVPGRRRGGGV